MSQEIVPAGPRDMAFGILRPLVKPDEMIAAQQEIGQLIVKALKPGVDYGEIPGTRDSKPVLLKPGAERLQKAFGCHTTFEILEREVDHDREVPWRKHAWNYQTRRKEDTSGTSLGLYRYVVQATVIGPNGQPVGSGVGMCSSLESKYVDRPRDLENTILKMAQKRAKVSATLDAFGLSGRFTPDLDEDSGSDDETPPPAAAKKGDETDGYDPHDVKHQNWLLKQLKAKGVPEDRHDDVGNALKGKPASEIDAVIAAVVNTAMGTKK
jgi:hypothetical protein